MRVTPAVAWTPTGPTTSAPVEGVRTTATATTSVPTRSQHAVPNSGRDEVHSPSSPTMACSSSGTGASASSGALPTCFYFTVFFSNNAPIFHSNRIPAKLLGLSSSPPGTAAARDATHAPCSHSGATPGETKFPLSTHQAATDAASNLCASCQQRRWQAVFADAAETRMSSGAAASPPTREGFTVGDFRSESAVLDEVPQQTLQTVAFPTTFGCCTGSSSGSSGGGACPLPVRTLKLRRRRNSLSAHEVERDEENVMEDLSAMPAAAAATTALSPLAVVRGKAKEVEEAASHDSSTSEGTNPKTGVQSITDGSSTRFSAASSVQTQHPPQHCTQNASTSHSRRACHIQHGIATHSPNTLPLTTTVSTAATSSTAATTPTAGTTTSTSALPARFQPTFPSVTWEEEEEVTEKKEPQREEVAGKLLVMERTDVEPQEPTNAINAASAASPTAAASSTTVIATTERVEGAPVRARRPRQRDNAAAPSSLADTRSTPAAAAAAPLRRSRPSLTATTAATPAADKSTASPLAPPATAAVTPQPAASSSLGGSGIQARQPSIAPPPPPPPPAASGDTAVDVTPTPIVHEGPPWNMRVEEVRSAKGDLRYYRFIIAVSFAALITTHTGVLHSMQTRNAATALVLTCPPSGVHYRFFLHHVDVLRSALNRATEFGIRTVQRFFGLLFSPTQMPSGTQQQILKAITSRLEMHSEACETYRAVKAELASALGVLWPLPQLSPATAPWVTPILMHASLAPARTRVGGSKGGRAAFGGTAGSTATTSVLDARHGSSRGGDGRRSRSGASTAMRWLSAGGVGGGAKTRKESTTATSTAAAPPPSLSELLCEATAGLCDYSEGFASAFVCGLLSLAEEGEGRWRTRLHGRAAEKDDAVVAPPTEASSPVGSPTIASAVMTREVSCALPSLSNVDATTPEWLSAYSTYFDNITTHADASSEAVNAGGRCSGGGDCVDGWIRLTRPPKRAARTNSAAAAELRVSASDDEDDEDNACLRTHVSASTVSSMTPVLSPLTIDVEARSPSARLLRGRTLAATTAHALQSSGNGGAAAQVPVAAYTFNGSGTGVTNSSWATAAATAAPLTPTTAQLYTISAETSITSHATTLAVGAVTGPVNNNNNSSSNAYNGSGGGGGEGAATNMSGLSRLPASKDAAVTTTAAGVSSSTPVSSRPSLRQQQQESTSRPLRTATAASSSSATNAKDDVYSLHRGRLGRVVIFTQDATLARRLLLVAAFLWSESLDSDDNNHWGGMGNTASSSPRGRNIANSNAAFRCEDAQRMYETAIAAAVTSADFANVPIQWVAEEFSEARLATLCSRFSPENTLLVVVPRQLQCRRVRLRKHVAGTTVLVEQQAGREARIRSPAFPFQCSVTRQTVLLPDPTVTTLLREARSLHEASCGTVDFAEVFQRMVKWLYWQTAAALLKSRDTQGNAAAASTLAATAEQERRGGGVGVVTSDMPRYASADLLWPSRSVSATGSRATTPTLVTPVALPHDFPRLHGGAASSVISASPCSPALQLSRSWPLDSAEDSLLPGSRGGASAAWAYTVPAGSTSHSTSVGGGGGGCLAAAASTPLHTTSTLLMSHGLMQPHSAFVTASPTVPTTPQKSSSLRFLSWFKSSPTSTKGCTGGAAHPHPVLSPTTLMQLSAADGGQLPRLLAEDEA